MIINFLYKVKTLTSRGGDKLTEIKVFDCIQNVTRVMKFDGELGEIEVKYHLQTSRDFQYKNFIIYFSNASKLKFK